jgi:hypothetical protein
MVRTFYVMAHTERTSPHHCFRVLGIWAMIDELHRTDASYGIRAQIKQAMDLILPPPALTPPPLAEQEQSWMEQSFASLVETEVRARTYA